VLQEAMSRIQSVAVIHEFLSLEESQTINMRDVCQRIITQNEDVLAAPGQQISFTLEGPAIYLPSQQATACALVVNELIHNALEHGFEDKRNGQVRVSLDDRGDQVHLEIWDDGIQLPDEFDLVNSQSLGLQIVRSLAQFDLHGYFRLENVAEGVAATVEFPKVAMTQELPRKAENLVSKP
jgi:two-component sensor histidine kinase